MNYKEKNTMTRIELIEFIGDVLTRLDVLIGSMLPSNPDRKPFIDARKQLDDMLLEIRKDDFNDKTQKFKNATDEIVELNKELKKTIDDLNRLVETMGTITKFISAVDKIIQTFVL
jgi:hypothetical protein